MAVEMPRINYSGTIRSIHLGDGEKGITVGGEVSYPFYSFEGASPNLPRIAMEVYDEAPSDWPEAAKAPFVDVMGNPVAWAKKCVQVYGAEMICLQLQSTDPNGSDRDPRTAAKVVAEVAYAIDVPLIVWGTANHEKDIEVLRAVAELVQDRCLALGPVEEGDYKKIAAAAMAYGHTVIASSPIDINLAKQLNILMANLGVKSDNMIMDPTVSAIGYGIEYAYSVMERIRMAALTQQDEKLQFPLICNIARETWKSKEAKISESEDPRLGDAEKRGITLEAMSATLLLLAGADILIMRHPEAIKLVSEMIGDLS
ncbi:acetyl-CoA decarbonylase/synthase complex subunit delta [Dehalogenimonas etheniformans]|uniref:Acetyl-CoA decarbonylase/synthase complex subunit delta n=1 Tax=Dehalogenimonas etheniformans TaxID=1536648 RepID=A0A2P5P9H2_9CHLR|nr:acetyl-CoA decarbonylase/synthase complex subunit delta [Dehalogenimonas etheniformans]PPD58930.1 acetyl-CoA decarbonylase/synthase complex subunit delta [Dehalogenimonas etheniformans]QNT76303.1 acetyl-CoA decarbonylase/synthase complex subunit delta [Dehalogenimonas etheniformans]